MFQLRSRSIASPRPDHAWLDLTASCAMCYGNACDNHALHGFRKPFGPTRVLGDSRLDSAPAFAVHKWASLGDGACAFGWIAAYPYRGRALTVGSRAFSESP
jgi:hypothetical protein